jgi:hypothetical protein
MTVQEWRSAAVEAFEVHSIVTDDKFFVIDLAAI